MPDFSRNQLIAAYVIVGLALLGTGVLVAKSGIFGAPGGSIRFIEAGATTKSDSRAGSSEEIPTEPIKLCVHIAGMVKTPGLYSLEPGARINDAIKSAGGAVGDADLESINLAAKVSDGQQIYIAPKGKISPPMTSVVRGGEPKTEQQARPAGLNQETKDDGLEELKTSSRVTININTASLEELQRLPGVGPATTEKIIEYRTQHGRFQSVEELDEVKGIGPAKLAKLRPFVEL